MRRSEVRNAPFREASRREVEPEAGWGEGQSPDLYRADAREARSLCASSWFMLAPVAPVLRFQFPSSWFMLAPVSPVLRFFFPLLGSCARGPVSGQLVETRTGGAAEPAVWWTCASGRGVPERVRRPRGRPEPGATTLTVVGEGLDDH